MEMMSGYKQTEVGVIPEDWECTTVGQLAQSGAIHKPLDGNHGNIHPKSGDFVNFGIPFVMANNVRNGTVDVSNCSFIRKEQADSLQKGFSLPGDVLLTHKATIGNTAVVGEIPFEYIMLTPQVTYYRVADKTRLSNWYLRHYFDSASFQQVLISLSGGGTRAYIGITAQLQLPIVVPPVPEQEAIAEALSDADALIESLEQLVATKRHLKQGVMQELLRPKDGWSAKTLGGSTEIITKGTTPTSIGRDFTSSGINFLKAESISASGQPIPSKMAFIDQVTHNLLKRSQLIEGDILISIAGVLGRVGTVNKSLLPANTNQALAIIRLGKNAEFERGYLFYYLRSPMIEQQINDINVQAAQANISLRNVRDFQVHVPPSQEGQTAIASVLSDMDAEIAALEAKLARYRQIKQGMMHNLLTGRIRLI